MTKLILNTHFNHTADGEIKTYQKGEDVSHLPKEIKQFLIDNKHVQEVEEEKKKKK